MSHDAWAAFSSIELARDCQNVPSNWFNSAPPWDYQTYATRDPSPSWPLPDGAIEIGPLPTGKSRLVAVEFKRTNEGLHGILTGLGQVHAYLSKGFAASVLVLPSRYDGLTQPGQYASAVLDSTAPNSPIGVFTYNEPDLTSASPFHDRLQCARSLNIDPITVPLPNTELRAGRQRTQWAHVREGSTVPDILRRYLATTLNLTTGRSQFPAPRIRPELVAAVSRIDPTAGPAHFLSNTSPAPRRQIADEAWRRFWFDFILTPPVQTLWRGRGANRVPDTSATELVRWNGEKIVFFARSDGIKAKTVREMLAGSLTVSSAWEKFATNIRARAHQLREDVDSGLQAAGFIAADGRVTDLGVRFVLACDQAGDATAPRPLAILKWALLTNGGYLALLHYVHSISEEVFRANELKFSKVAKNPPRVSFQSVPYRSHLADELVETLHVAGRSALRGGRKRPPLEAEIITMRKLGLVGDFRAGVGLEINWPAVHAALEVEITHAF